MSLSVTEAMTKFRLLSLFMSLLPSVFVVHPFVCPPVHPPICCIGVCGKDRTALVSFSFEFPAIPLYLRLFAVTVSNSVKFLFDVSARKKRELDKFRFPSISSGGVVLWWWRRWFLFVLWLAWTDFRWKNNRFHGVSPKEHQNEQTHANIRSRCFCFSRSFRLDDLPPQPMFSRKSTTSPDSTSRRQPNGPTEIHIVGRTRNRTNATQRNETKNDLTSTPVESLRSRETVTVCV